jgi:dTDP-4-dehydrorhamnose reductase
MRVLLLGAGGMLAHDLAATAPPDADLVPLTHRDLDITDAAALEKSMRAIHPDVILNAAAYTAVDRAELERDRATGANHEAVGEIGRQAAKQGSYVVHFSTDYVFDGAGGAPYPETASPHPLNHYGASKLEGERALTASGARALIIRSQWLFGSHGRSFPRTMWERAKAGLVTRVVRDQRGRPTHTADLAQATWILLRSQTTGLLHVANAGEASWYEVAREVFEREGKVDLLSACATSDYVTPAMRPLDTRLDCGRAISLLGRPLPSWRNALDRFFENRTIGAP